MIISNNCAAILHRRVLDRPFRGSICSVPISLAAHNNAMFEFHPHYLGGTNRFANAQDTVSRGTMLPQTQLIAPKVKALQTCWTRVPRGEWCEHSCNYATAPDGDRFVSYRSLGSVNSRNICMCAHNDSLRVLTGHACMALTLVR